MIRKVFFLFFILAVGCAAKKGALLPDPILEGESVCLSDEQKIPSFIEKFYQTRDLTTEEGKIDYLIERINRSSLVFTRNKVRYDGVSGASFIRWKMNRWRKQGVEIVTAQQFVDKVTSGSKVSGQPYMVILQDGSRHSLKDVMQNELDILTRCLGQYVKEEQQTEEASAEKLSAVDETITHYDVVPTAESIPQDTSSELKKS